MSPTTRYAKKQAKPRQRRRLQAQHAATVLDRPSMTWASLKTS